MRTAFRIVNRKGGDRRHPMLVFDLRNRLHFPLTIFAVETINRYSAGTARAYLNAILPFFSWIETDEWQKRCGRCWDDAPEQIRQAVQEYLIARLKCKLRQHSAGFQMVSLSGDANSTVRIFLSALKLYYQLMRSRGLYPNNNPLIDGLSAIFTKPEGLSSENDSNPRIPQQSGVVAARKKQRLSDSYFKLVGEIWVPHIIDDPQFPATMDLPKSVEVKFKAISACGVKRRMRRSRSNISTGRLTLLNRLV